ncbi:MAG: hypothetical protein ACP5IA_10980 [Sediminispirochaetaceae bacterium]
MPKNRVGDGPEHTMKRSSFKHSIAEFTGAALLSGAVLLVLFLSACGIPQYPYLYPPEASGYPAVGFTHDSDNRSLTLGEGPFVGYDIYYKFYKDDPYTSSTAINEKNSYFNSSSAFKAIAYDNESLNSTVYNNGFRKLIIADDSTSSNPSDRVNQLIINENEISKSFEVSLTDDNLNDIVKLAIDYIDEADPSVKYVYRIASEAAQYKSFLPFDDTNYEPGTDTDFENFTTEDLQSTIYVAFFAVTYGRDDNGVDIFSNYSSDGMVYIGSFEFN